MSFHVTLGPNNLLPSEWVVSSGVKVSLTPDKLFVSDGLVFVTLDNSEQVPIGLAINFAQDVNTLFVIESP